MSSQMCRGKSVCFTFAVILIAILQQTFAQCKSRIVKAILSSQGAYFFSRPFEGRTCTHWREMLVGEGLKPNHN